MRREIYIRVPVHTPYEAAAEVLRHDPRGVIGSAANELRMDVGKSTVSRAVLLAVGGVEVDPDEIRVPVSWRAESHSELFPVLTGELLLAPRGWSDVELGLVGTYEPPLGGAGDLGDRMVGHRVADHTIRGFLESVARRLATLVAERAESSVGRVVPPGGGPASAEYRDEQTCEPRG